MLRKIAKMVVIGIITVFAGLTLFVILGLWAQYTIEERMIAKCEAQGGIVMYDATPGPYCIMDKKERPPPPQEEQEEVEGQEVFCWRSGNCPSSREPGQFFIPSVLYLPSASA